jgi:hypothetical protein
MKVSIQNLIGIAVVSLSLSACGNNSGTTYTNATGQSCNSSTGVCLGNPILNGGGGSAQVASGVIGFTLNNPSFNQALTTMVGGTVPTTGSFYGGNYGQAFVGTGTSTSAGVPIQYSQKQSVANGQFSIFGTSGSLTGTIQLGQIPMQALIAVGGQNATITNIGVYIIQSPASTYGTYAFVINEVHVYFYVNGSNTPIEVIF